MGTVWEYFELPTWECAVPATICVVAWQHAGVKTASSVEKCDAEMFMHRGFSNFKYVYDRTLVDGSRLYKPVSHGQRALLFRRAPVVPLRFEASGQSVKAFNMARVFPFETEVIFEIEASTTLAGLLHTARCLMIQHGTISKSTTVKSHDFPTERKSIRAVRLLARPAPKPHDKDNRGKVKKSLK